MMELKDVMRQKTFVIVGDTLNETKYAYKIKHAMIEKGYKVYCVGKELASINDIDDYIDIVDLCIHPAKGIEIMKDCKKPFRTLVIQPGAESPELLAFLKEQKTPYIQDCLLIGLRQYT